MVCKLYVDEEFTTVGHSLEEGRRIAAPYIQVRRALKIVICQGSTPIQAWAYDHDIQAWVLQRSLGTNNGDQATVPAAAP